MDWGLGRVRWRRVCDGIADRVFIWKRVMVSEVLIVLSGNG